MSQPLSAEVPSSRIVSREPRTLSQTLWGLDWADHTPWTFGDVTIVSARFADLEPFLGEHYAALFEAEGGRFLVEATTEAKRRFLSMLDVFLMKAAGRTVGFTVAQPLDWSSYYVRSGAVLPEYRDRQVASRLMDAMVEPLRACGVQRMEADCSPANTVMVRMLTRLGYVVTGTNTSERWGTLLHWTKFLDAEANAVFRRQFCSMPLDHVINKRDGTERRDS